MRLPRLASLVVLLAQVGCHDIDALTHGASGLTIRGNVALEACHADVDGELVAVGTYNVNDLPCTPSYRLNLLAVNGTPDTAHLSGAKIELRSEEGELLQLPRNDEQSLPNPFIQATNDNLAAGSKSIVTVEVIPAHYRAALQDVGSRIHVRVVLTTTGSGSRDSNVFDYEVELRDTPCTKTAREVACNFDELDAGTQNDASNGQLDSSLTQSDASQDASGSHDGSKQIDDGGADGAMDGSSESCAATQGSAWALWPMPNAPGSGLPNTADYTDNGDGTVTDEVTGLMWRKAVETSLYWEETMWMCEDLVLGGHCDWRVPSRIELASLVDVSRTSPTIDTSAFPGTSVGYFWSSTPLLGSSSKAWAVSFALGLVREGNTGIGGGGDAFSLRCVRTERAGTQHAYQTDAATVTDASTSLTWQANLDAGSMDWNAASAYCSGLTTASGGWRLPSVKELLTLVDDAHGPPAIDTTFSGTPSTTFWSSSIDAADSNKAWMVDFAGGGSSTDSATVAHRVRCVR